MDKITLPNIYDHDVKLVRVFGNRWELVTDVEYRFSPDGLIDISGSPALVVNETVDEYIIKNITGDDSGAVLFLEKIATA